MANYHPPVGHSRPARKGRRIASPLRTLVALAAMGVGYLGFSAAALGPSSELPTSSAPGRIAVASLGSAGTDFGTTGSIPDLFASAVFSGPNRAGKSDRYRPTQDPLAIARSFQEVRTRLAALRMPKSDPALMGQSQLADLGDEGMAMADDEIGPRMSVASLGPTAGGALSAIEGIAPQMAVPTPATASEQLAYARETAPVTGAFSTGKSMEASSKEMWCLATAIYFEARGESYRGQVAVAQVVLNRVKDHRYPGTICGVVFQNQARRNACQFSFACDGIPEAVTERKPWEQAEDIATKVVNGELYLTEVGDATHYHATYVRPAWAPRMQKVTQIGLHVFYKFKRGWLFG